MSKEELLQAVDYVAKGPPIGGITNEMKLKLYALFKQATKGECTEKEPSRLQVVQRMKWNAYKALGKMSQEEARKQYIAQLDKVAPGWRTWKSNPRSKL